MSSVQVQQDGYVAIVEIRRPPHNFFDVALIRELADQFEALDGDPACRALVLASEGRSFCAGANFRSGEDQAEGVSGEELRADRLYEHGLRLFAAGKPVVAAVQGAAVGGGLGLALVADFRVVTPSTRLVANFVQLGIHPGFGLTHTLPRLVGMQKAQEMFLSAAPVSGEAALEIGLADRLVADSNLRDAAMELAQEIAANAPLAVQSTRATLRAGLVEAVRAQMAHEFREQTRLFDTRDHAEGVRAVRERRPGRFTGN